MSSTYSQESAASPSASNEPECEPSPSARSTPIAKSSSESTGQMSLFMEIFPASRQSKFSWKTDVGEAKQSGQLISSAAASPARTYPLPERARALRASAAAYGRSTPELLARYDPATSSWRTSQLCLDGALAEFSETWPRSGTMRNGTAYQLPPLVPLTDEIGSGLWPTPKEQNARGAGEVHGDGGPSLDVAVGGSLNPTWVEWLMGFPLGWTALEASATPSSRKSRKSSGGR